MMLSEKDNKRLLFIDDDEINNFILQELFSEEEDLSLSFYSDSQAAFDYLKQQAADDKGKLPNIIFMDIKMPILDGFEFMDRLEQQGLLQDKKVDIFMLSSTLDSRDVQRAASYDRILELVTKPLTVEKFRELMERYPDTAGNATSRSKTGS